MYVLLTTEYLLSDVEEPGKIMLGCHILEPFESLRFHARRKHPCIRPREKVHTLVFSSSFETIVKVNSDEL